MSLITALNHTLSGMRAIQADMQVISSNVSNAGRDDYTKKKVVLSANTSSIDGTGGVNVVGYSRSTSDAVSKLLNLSLADDGLRSTQKDYLDSIQDLIGSNQDNPTLTTAMSDLATAWKSLAASPEDTTRKQTVIFKAQNLTREITRLADGLDRITTQAKDDMESSVTTLNASLTRIGELNLQIVSAQSTGGSAGDFMDLRDVEIQKVAELTKINVVPRDQGRVALYTPGGVALLDGVATQFTWNGTSILQGTTDVTSRLKEGKLEALAGVLDQGSSATTLNDPGKASVYKIGLQLNKIVDMFTNAAGTFAVAYNSATTASGEQASAFFTGTTRYDFAVNSALLAGTTTLKQAAATGVAADMDVSTRSISAGNLSITNSSYATFADAIVYTHSQNTKQISEQATIFSTQKDNYSKRLKDEVGVNVDEEIVRLTQLQNNYAASARVISMVQQMFDILNRL